jgi:hypothetical protein
MVLAGRWLEWLPYAGLGWFMGLRAAWVLLFLGVAGASWRTTPRTALGPALLLCAPVAVITLVAADTGRTTTMLLPLVLLGVNFLVTQHGADIARRWVGGLLLANLLIPAMHVTYQHGDLINCLRIEAYRYLRHG